METLYWVLQIMSKYWGGEEGSHVTQLSRESESFIIADE